MFLPHKSHFSLLRIMIIKGILIANVIDTKVAISVEISVTGACFQFASLIGILIVRAVKSISFL